jgi:anti-anti-sigma regulatory factor
MIVSTKDDVVQLAGSLVKNQWLTIKAAANLLIADHPNGIVVDCSELEHVSDEGAKTFLQAMQDIESAGARIVVATLPNEVMQVLRTVPGVRSQLPIAATVEEARASLRMCGQPSKPDKQTPSGPTTVLLPLLPNLDIPRSLAIAQRIHRDAGGVVHGVAFLVVARNLALGTPLPEEETEANRLMEQASTTAKALNIPFVATLERVRDGFEGILQAVKTHHAERLIVSAATDHPAGSDFIDLATGLLKRAPCVVIVERAAHLEGGGSTSENLDEE